MPTSIDADRFDPASVSAVRLDAIRRAWGVTPDTKVILVVGRMLRRKGHHVAVKAVHLKQRGLKDFVCVFAGEDQGRTRYTGELWDLISATGTTDVVRSSARSTTCRRPMRRRLSWSRPPCRPKGCSARSSRRRPWRARSWCPILRPVRRWCWRLRRCEEHDRAARPADDEAALAAALIRLFSLSDSARSGIGARGRAWMKDHFDAASVERATLALYADISRGSAWISAAASALAFRR